MCNQHTSICTGCKLRYWSLPLCDQPCPSHCNESCTSADGSCIVCSSGWWGADCQLACPSQCVACDKTTATCTSCSAGHWGNNCQHTCSAGCKCSQYDGTCMWCNDGYWGVDSNCSHTCENCPLNWCSAIDGHCLGGGSSPSSSWVKILLVTLLVVVVVGVAGAVGYYVWSRQQQKPIESTELYHRLNSDGN
eukprot:gnl/Spiro4/24331_TR12088_c0_g1_i1.p2 gnl/Spiro4/24331_TR12088_c0_g1~~gnl/Spiro4/24331_TR12088_c0_g1_i1.p2  ORF type:complete len:192 (+),score=33.73 gnl/Spiro4/24331_TR12088_c0_g1_i1:672-1247(+)